MCKKCDHPEMTVLRGCPSWPRGEAAWRENAFAATLQLRLQLWSEGVILDIRAPGDATWRGPKAQTDGPSPAVPASAVI